MAMKHNWADLCSSITIHDGHVKMHFGVVDPVRPKDNEDGKLMKPGIRVSGTEVMIMPISGFVQMLSTLDQIRNNATIKSALESRPHSQSGFGEEKENENLSRKAG
ncbi:hypothetical protein [Leisingera sp. ANG-Vp]|uniref:hypothetical protein n=1 Tax=Leisingera sp. ANG-Vp TaxID=1577896 RepID=UPI00126A5973|nr:hypothetical protein [Leisingera sp. ANG-Vp]